MNACFKIEESGAKIRTKTMTLKRQWWVKVMICRRDSKPKNLRIRISWMINQIRRNASFINNCTKMIKSALWNHWTKNFNNHKSKRTRHHNYTQMHKNLICLSKSPNLLRLWIPCLLTTIVRILILISIILASQEKTNIGLTIKESQ